MFPPSDSGAVSLRHWYVGLGEPVALTVNCAIVPLQGVTGPGWRVKLGQTGLPGLMVMMPAPDVACWPSGLVTVSVRPPVAAAGATSTFTVKWVGSVKVTELTVIPVPLK